MHSNTRIAAAFITLSLLVPAFASATSKPAPKDTTPPVIAAHADVVVESPVGSPMVATYTKPTATDAKDGSVVVTCTPASGTTFAMGNTTVTCSAQDAAGNKATKTFKVVVRDTTPAKPTAIHIQSSNVDPSKAVAGDTVTISFTTSEKATPFMLVETKALFVKSRTSGLNSWDASYVVNAKDPKGKVDYLMTLVDAAGNISLCSSAHLFLIGYCPTTDGSSVTVGTAATTTPPATTTPDTVAPVIAAHSDLYATTTGESAEVSYTLPTANDAKDGSVAVTCTPVSGSTFAVGSSTVACSAQDAAGNTAHSAFVVGVTHVEPPVPPGTAVTLASQDDESYLCGENTGTWRSCDFDAQDNPGPGFTAGLESSSANVDLGRGGHLLDGALQAVTIATQQNRTNPWLVSIQCYSDAAHTSACADWVAPTAANGNRTDLIKEFAANNPSSDNTHWVADFTNAAREKNFDGSSPVTFNAAYYYALSIDDGGFGGVEAPAYGSQSLLQPYYVISGATQ